MTKTEILTALNSFISAVGKVTKTRHTSANSLFVDELYSTVKLAYKLNVGDIPTGSDILGLSNNNSIYYLALKKTGNIVYIKGYIFNASTISGGAPILTITDTELYPKTSLGQNIFATKQGTTPATSESIFRLYSDINNASQLFVSNPANANDFIYIDSYYFTND